jgi:hypothetical protein
MFSNKIFKDVDFHFQIFRTSINGHKCLWYLLGIPVLYKVRTSSFGSNGKKQCRILRLDKLPKLFLYFMFIA